MDYGYTSYVVVALFTVAVMLMLFVDIIRRSIIVTRSAKSDLNEAEDMIREEHVYPFYVDCSQKNYV